jgi:hypothetical protein
VDCSKIGSQEYVVDKDSINQINLLIKKIPITIDYDVEEPSTYNPLSQGAGVLFSIIQFISLRHPLAFYGLPGIALLIVSSVFINNTLELFQATRYRL